MPRLKPILALTGVIGALALAGCGGDDQPKPSIPVENAQTLLATLQEVQANVDNGSCLVAADKVQELNTELSQLPSSVNNDVVDALQRGSLSLGDLVEQQCDSGTDTTTTDETTTDETTDTQETTTEQTTTQQTTTTAPPTTTTQPPNTGGGGVGPPGGGNGL